MEETDRKSIFELTELLTLRGQLRREIELASEKGMLTLPAKRKLTAVNKEIAKIKRGEAKGDLFDTQLDLFETPTKRLSG